MDAHVSLPAWLQVGVNRHSPAEAKIALFRSLFRGREDVYPRRFESRKTGRAGQLRLGGLSLQADSCFNVNGRGPFYAEPRQAVNR